MTERISDLHPIAATESGVAGRDHLPTDYSPEGHQARADMFLSSRAELWDHLEHPDPVQRRAAQVMVGWLDTRIEESEMKMWSWDLNHIVSPLQEIRDVFDVMPSETAEQWEPIIARLNAISFMLEGYADSLRVGLEAGEVVARRQAESALAQAEAAAGGQSRFLDYLDQAESVGVPRGVIEGAVDHARGAFSRFADWIRERYLPHAEPSDAAGEDRYRLAADSFLGMPLDLEETYQWGWDEVHRIRAEMVATAAEVDSSLNLEEVIELLENDPDRSAASRDDFAQFVQEIQDQAIGQLAGVHFDVPEPIRAVTVNIAPPGGALGAWYMGPSEDFSRPGSIWYAPGERERIPYWQEVTTAYHEGFPGHHLQVGYAQLQSERLSRFHRQYIWYSGSGEGWALYAERLMDELGFFAKPEYRLGLLASQLFRSTRVVVDIGSHLELKIPSNAPLHGDELWNYDRAVDYMERVGLQARDVAESEVKRYLGWCAQAISYKVGEREILAIRDDAAMDRRQFHKVMLEEGAIRLDHLRQALVG